MSSWAQVSKANISGNDKTSLRTPLATPTFIWDGGCANHADVQYLDLGYGHTLESCNSECHQLNWCTHINLNNINNLCKVFASGCTNDAGNSAVYKYYKSAEMLSDNEENFDKFMIATGNLKYWTKIAKSEILTQSTYNFKKIQVTKSSLTDKSYDVYQSSGVVSLISQDALQVATD